MPHFENLRVGVEGVVGWLQLHRPNKLNALSPDLLKELIAAAGWFDTQTHVKVVTVAGAGRAFSAGADLSGFSGPDVISTRDVADLGRQMADALEAMRAILIAGIQGWCVGGAVVLASACDLRIAAEDAMFSIPEIDLGIPLAWGGVPRLIRELGPALTRELVLTGRSFDAAEAKAAGFLNRVVPGESLEGEVAAMAEMIAAKPAYPLRATKLHVNAVTAQMVGKDRSWSDADRLLTAFNDPEGAEMREKYLQSRK